MNGMKDIFENRLTPRDKREHVEKTLLLGEWEFDQIDAESKIKEIDFSTYEHELYYRYLASEYGEYEQCYDNVIDVTNYATRKIKGIDREGAWDFAQTAIEESQFQWPNEDDDEFITHLENQYDPSTTLGGVHDVSEEAAELWLRYLLDRGANGKY